MQLARCGRAQAPTFARHRSPVRSSIQHRRRGLLTPCKTAAVELGSALEQQQQQGPAAAGAPSQQQQQGSASPAPAAAAAGEEGAFNWLAAWYPIAALTALQKDAPNAQQLLGMRLVVWWDKNGSCWRCFEDLCPHRLAPLSEGRIHESGALQCTYHGWTFEGSGRCSSIPQLPDRKAAANACASSRSCVRSHPVAVRDGLLWVYGEASSNSSSSSSSNGSGNGNGVSAPQQQQQQQEEEGPPAELLLSEGFEIKSPWFQRDVPLSFDILLENFLDPAHVPHSHHGIVGDREADHTLLMELDGKLRKQGGFDVATSAPARWGDKRYPLVYRPPCLVRHQFPGDVRLVLYGIPTAAGHSRVIMSFEGPPSSSASRPPTPQLPPLVNFFADLIDKVPALQHALNRNMIIDGDTYFLHAAERVLYERGDSTSWRRQYYMPGSSDVAVMAWRRWLDTFGHTLPTLPKSAADIPALMPREQVLDRLKQHTQVCPHCSSALRGATIAAGVMAALAAVAAGSVVAAVVAGTAPLLSPFTGAAVAVAAAAGLLTAALLRFRQLFIFTDYVHAEH